jgi:hypothetical protein
VTPKRAASIGHNSANTDGGGVVLDGASLTLNDTSIITLSTAGTDGRGVNNNFGAVTLNGGTVTGTPRQLRRLLRKR